MQTWQNPELFNDTSTMEQGFDQNQILFNRIKKEAQNIFPIDDFDDSEQYAVFMAMILTIAITNNLTDMDKILEESYEYSASKEDMDYEEFPCYMVLIHLLMIQNLQNQQLIVRNGLDDYDLTERGRKYVQENQMD